MKIAVGNSRTSRAWKVKDISWKDFVQRCSQTIYTTETVQEYRKLPKGQQDNIKDVGGFVGGELRNGIRKKDSVINRCLLTLDADYADEDFWEQIELFFDFRCLLYSTHKHIPEQPRLRLIIPLSRPVTSDEYTAIARRVAADIGIEQFDDTTYQPHRLMYWPSTSTDGEFVFKEREGREINADAVLARYKDWHDTSEYPVSSRQKKIVTHALKKQANPLEKDGVVGAFCRAYTIHDVISEFLSDVYEPSSLSGRYDYIPADSIAGVITYGDKFAYSHHATDPACDKLCNAFDLVRIHKFSYLDKDDNDSEKSASFKAMMDFAQNDGKVKTQSLTDKETAVQENFSVLDDNDVLWTQHLTMNKRGDIENSIQNLTLILQNDSALQGIVFNQLSDSIEIRGDVPWQHPSKYWRDADDAQLLTYLTYRYGKFTRANYDVALAKVVDDRSYHPIREYLDSLPEWDGIARVDTLLIDYLGAEDNPYTCSVTRKTLCGAIARVITPGVKFDTMLVLSGPQGIGKSTIISKLCGEWFNDSLLLSDTKDKTAAEKLQGFWILEIGELAGLKKTEIETLRGFISRQNDVFRASFGRRATPHLRQCIFIGTTNAEHGYLRDTTGNRRFFPIKVSGNSIKKSWEITQDEVNQIWAEALVYYRANEPLILDEETAKFAKDLQREAMETDEREGMVREYLETLLPENWNEMSLYERRNFLNGSEFGDVLVKGTVKRNRVCNMEIWCECFGKAKADLKRLDANSISTIMAKMEGWQKASKKSRFGVYGIVAGYERIF
jgi:putative DNA primase/helicase|nr:MAG TPA: replicative DNA helicase [Caudoviricetes sp.]